MRIRPGRCLVCGCTDRWGCHWVDNQYTLCSRCAANMARLVLRWREMRWREKGTP